MNQIVQTHSKPLRSHRWVPDFKPLYRNKCSNSVLKQCGNFALKIEMAKKGLDSLVLRHSRALEDEGKSVSVGERTLAYTVPWSGGELPSAGIFHGQPLYRIPVRRGWGAVRKRHIKHALCTSGHKSPWKHTCAHCSMFYCSREKRRNCKLEMCHTLGSRWGIMIQFDKGFLIPEWVSKPVVKPSMSLEVEPGSWNSQRHCLWVIGITNRPAYPEGEILTISKTQSQELLPEWFESRQSVSQGDPVCCLLPGNHFHTSLVHSFRGKSLQVFWLKV